MVLYQVVLFGKPYVMSVIFMNLSESGYFSYLGHCVYKLNELDLPNNVVQLTLFQGKRSISNSKFNHWKIFQVYLVLARRPCIKLSAGKLAQYVP